MNNKINIAELLKDCPRGMELYSPIYGFGNLTKVTDRIHVKFPKEHNVKCFRLDGKVSENGEVMIFPKGKTTWEGFQRPFKNGEVVTSVFQGVIQGTGIFDYEEQSEAWIHVCINLNNEFSTDGYLGHVYNLRLATEEEKQKLFEAIKDNGYRWNTETKTLEELIKPKFKVGDNIVKRNCINNSWIVSSVSSEYYGLKLPNNSDSIGVLPVSDQDDWELVSNKFDIATLKPFESRVLMRDKNTEKWVAQFFSHYNNGSDRPYTCIGCEGLNEYIQCIPYEGNEHLLDTTNDCDEFYKTW